MENRYKARCKRRCKDRLAWWALVLVAVSPLIAWYGRALAAGALPPRLQIVLVGPPPVADLLAAAIAPLLPATAPVDWRRVTDDAAVAPMPALPSGPRIWIDGRLPGTVQIVAFCRDAVPRVRTVVAPELTPVVAETVAQITRETGAVLLAEAQRERASNGEGSPLARPAPVPASTETDATIAASAGGATHPSHELLIAGSAIVRDEFGLDAPAATGVALSVLYPLRRLAAGSSARPFLALSLELFSVSRYQMVAQEIVETTGSPGNRGHFSISPWVSEAASRMRGPVTRPSSRRNGSLGRSARAIVFRWSDRAGCQCEARSLLCWQCPRSGDATGRRPICPDRASPAAPPDGCRRRSSSTRLSSRGRWFGQTVFSINHEPSTRALGSQSFPRPPTEEASRRWSPATGRMEFGSKEAMSSTRTTIS